MGDATPAARIVVAVDGSRPSIAALHWAARRARRLGLPLTLVHVDIADVDEPPSQLSGGPRAALGHELLEDAIAELAATEPDIQAHAVLVRGSLIAGLCTVLSEEDLLVIGTNKIGYLHGRVVGSRSFLVASAVCCDVAIVPDVDVDLRRGVLVGIDRRESTPTVSRVAADEAQHAEAELLVVHAYPTGDPDVAEQLLDEALREVRQRHPALPLRARLARQDPAVALLDASRDRELLVLGPGSISEYRAPVGSVFHSVLMNTPTPVLVVRRLEGVDVPSSRFGTTHARAAVR